MVEPRKPISDTQSLQVNSSLMDVEWRWPQGQWSSRGQTKPNLWTYQNLKTKIERKSLKDYSVADDDCLTKLAEI